MTTLHSRRGGIEISAPHPPRLLPLIDWHGNPGFQGWLRGISLTAAIDAHPLPLSFPAAEGLS